MFLLLGIVPFSFSLSFIVGVMNSKSDLLDVVENKPFPKVQSSNVKWGYVI